MNDPRASDLLKASEDNGGATVSVVLRGRDGKARCIVVATADPEEAQALEQFTDARSNGTAVNEAAPTG